MLTRRTFLWTAASAALAQAQPLTAAQVIDRIKTNVQVPWRAQTVDNIIAGSPETPVKGIATTMMATLDVAQRAARRGHNMLITHESTFFSHQDRIDNLKEDATYQYKLDALNKLGMVVFHFHDHWHAIKPDGIGTGMARELGWTAYRSDRLYTFPQPRTLLDLSKELQSKLHIRVMRVIGDPKLPVRKAMASWGNCSLFPGIPFLNEPDVDALIIGETHEWELVEYAQDMIASGKKKALIILGHVVSEQAGMKYCADWLRTFITEVPIAFFPASEPYWSPDRPVN